MFRFVFDVVENLSPDFKVDGPAPVIAALDTQQAEIETVGKWLADRINEGTKPHEIGVFVRSAAELGRARAAVEKAGLPFKMLDENVETTIGAVSISTMHLAKGLDFRAVAVMACDDEIIPLQERIETVTDDSEVINRTSDTIQIGQIQILIFKSNKSV